MIRSKMIPFAILAGVMVIVLAVPCLAQLTQVKITISNGSVTDGNVVYFQNEDAEFLLEADASCYAFVFVVSPEGKVRLAFPNQSHPFNMLEPHRALRVPEEGYRQRVPSETGWARFVAVASEDPSWAYSFSEFYAPKLWDVGAFSGWSLAGSSSVSNMADSRGSHAGAQPGQIGSARMRSQLREEMAQRGASSSSQGADLVLSRARAAVEGYRFAFSEHRFYVASNAYISHSLPPDDSYYYQGTGGYSWNVYENDLAPYGQWEFVVGCGYIWRPFGVGTTWAPYHRGRWVFTDYGWTWVSSEPWGWITYHYGYWSYTNRWGWVWIPGYVWGPAYVTWYWSEGYVAWRPAPLPPEISVSFNFYVKDCPVTIVARDHFEAVGLAKFARVKHLKVKGGALVALDGTKMTKLSAPSAEHQRKLARGPIKRFEVVPSTVGPAKGRTQGYYRVEKQRLYMPRPALTPTRQQRDRIFAPRPFPRHKDRATVVPKSRRSKPPKAQPKRDKPKSKPKKVKPKSKPKKVNPPKEEPKKTEPKELND